MVPATRLKQRWFRTALVCAALLLAGPPGAAGAGDDAPRAVPELPDSAIGASGDDGEAARVRARLLLDPDRPERVGVLFDVDPGWHIYWRNPGDSGLATSIAFAVNGEEEAGAGPLAWPAPHAFREPDGYGGELITYGYGGRVLLSAALAEAPRSGDTVGAVVDALVCESQCIPASFELARTVPDERSERSRERARALFAHFDARIPSDAAALGERLRGAWSQNALRPGDAVEGGVLVDPCATPNCTPFHAGIEPLYFFPEESDALLVREHGLRPHPDASGIEGFALALDLEIEDDADPEDLRLRGVLIGANALGARHAVRVDLALPRAERGAAVSSVALPWRDAPAAPPPSEAPPVSLAFALWAAFLGGLILNLMPCVLPVLAIKVVSVAELAHENRREVLKHGGAYAGGILLTMSLFAAVVGGLQMAGHRVGWGFQFQEPLFVAAVTTIVVVFALNLLGVFEIQFSGGRLASVGAESSGTLRSFFDGTLAVILATPCTAPFLGMAVTVAFASSLPVIFAIFAMIGLGLAAPFLLVTWIPAWSRIVPRPGPWMLKLRAGLGFMLLGAGVWLVWILGRSAGLDAVTALLAFLTFLAFAVWVYGNLPAERPAWVPVGLGAACLVAGALGVNAVSLAPSGGAGATDGDVLGEPYARTAVEARLAAGQSVFAYFTADWCITCKVNERRVLADPDVRADLEARDIAVFRGDWTRRDDALRAELARYGKAGVPVYVVLHPGAPARVLPELLTHDELAAALVPQAGGAP